MIKSRGNPTARLWFVIDKPYEKDQVDGNVISGAMGYHFDRFNSNANLRNYYVTTTDEAALLYATYQPPIICPLGTKATAILLPETKKKAVRKTGVQSDESSLEKYAGSLLRSTYIPHAHYCIPLLSPDAIIANWEYKFIHIQIDLGHVREELEYVNKFGLLQEHTKREIITEPDYSVLTEVLRNFRNDKLLSVDIETIHPKKGSMYYGRFPGHMYLMGIANSPYFAISFCLWKYTAEQTVNIFRLLNDLFKNVPQVGQNYFTFDTHYTEAYGLQHCLDRCEDTMLIHQILWPELPHKLQFLTKQYTRQPYYKDEGRGWSPKNLKRYMIYNALDCCITYEVYLGEQEELNDRPYLR